MARLYESFLWRRNPLLFFLLGLNSNNEYKLISRALRLNGSETVLDLACGPGIYTRRFAKEINRGKVHGMDLSGPMLKHGKELVQRNRLSNIFLSQGDALNLPFPESQFDIVNCAAALHLFGDLPRTFAEVIRVLKPSGRFTFSTFCYSEDKLIRLFQQFRRDLAGIRSFQRAEIEHGLEEAGFGEIRFLHAKRIWVVMSATKILSNRS